MELRMGKSVVVWDENWDFLRSVGDPPATVNFSDGSESWVEVPAELVLALSKHLY